MDELGREVFVKVQLHASGRVGVREVTLLVGRKGQSGTDVVLGQVREVIDDLRVSHPGSQHVKNLVNRDAETTDTGFPAALAGLDGDDGDDGVVVHDLGGF